MNDMTAYLGLDTRDYERGLRRAEQIAQTSGSRVADAFIKQQKKSFEQMLGGNWTKAGLAGLTTGFGLLIKAQSDFAEKNQWAAGTTSVLEKELSNLWTEIGGRTTLLFAELADVMGVAATKGQALTSVYRGFLQVLNLRDGQTERFLEEMKSMEKAMERQRVQTELLQSIETRWIATVAPEKYKQLQLEIELREKLAKIAEMERGGSIDKTTADKARQMERSISLEKQYQVDPEWWRAQVEPLNARREEAEKKKERLKEEADNKRKQREQTREQNLLDRRQIALQTLGEAAEIARLNNQEKRAIWLEYELTLQQKINDLNTRVLTDEQRKEAMTAARLGTTARLVAELRGVGKDRLLGGQAIESGLYSQSLSQQVLARNVQAADPSLKIAMDMLKVQQQAAGSLKSMDDTTRRLLEVSKRGTVATYAR